MALAFLPIRCQRYRKASDSESKILEPVDVSLIAEATVDLTVNGKTWLSFACTPMDLEALAVGFLYNEGFIQSRDEIALVEVCKQGISVDVWLKKPLERPTNWQRTSGCTGGLTTANQARVPAAVARQEVAGQEVAAEAGAEIERIDPESLLAGMVELMQGQDLYHETGGVHSSMISDGKDVRVRAEDIGRHNTLDKLAGRIVLEALQIQPVILLTTGRVSSEMLQKAARLGAVAVVSRTSPTSQSVALAQELGITLVGYARRGEFLVYSHPERLAVRS